MNRDEDYRLIVEFDTDDPQFARGVEVGMVYGELKSGCEEIVRDLPIRVINKNMVERVAAATGYNVIIGRARPSTERLRWLRHDNYESNRCRTSEAVLRCRSRMVG